MHDLPNSSLRPHSTPEVNSAEFALPLLGPSTAMAEVWAQVRRLAPYARTVLLRGAPDSGQDAAARLLLELSPVPGRPLLTWSSAEAELELAEGSGLQRLPAEALLYVQAVDQLSAAAQQGLLRLIRLRRGRALHLVVSSTVDLRVQVSLGQFAPELLEAISPATITLPALRSRKEDLPMLLNQMLALECAGEKRRVPPVSAAVLHAAMEHSWPGNLRELRSVAAQLARRSALSAELTAEHLGEAIGAVSAPRPSPPQVRMVALETVVHEHVCAVLRACRGNKLRAAETLGISRSTLYRMLEPPATPGAAPRPMQLAV